MQFRWTGRNRPRLVRAFTLIELLVVVAIIALLTAILFPAFARARENGRRTACLTNMKQIGMGMLQYTQDYDERWPMGSQKFEASYWCGTGWGGQIYPYVKNSQLFQCPDDTTLPTTANHTTVSYAANGNLTEFDTVEAEDTSLTQLIAPSQTVLLFEVQGSESEVSQPQEGNVPPYTCVSEGGNNMFCLGGSTVNNNGNALYATGYMGARPYATAPTGTCAWGPVTLTTGCYAAPTGRHLAGANYCLADGHAKWYTGSRVSSGTTALHATDPEPGTAQMSSSYAAGTQDPSGQFAVTFSIK